jgi:hypothetical protein
MTQPDRRSGHDRRLGPRRITVLPSGAVAKDGTSSPSDPARFREPNIQRPDEAEYRKCLEAYFNTSVGTIAERLENFPKYVPRQMLTQFLYRYEIFRRILTVHGSIIECGVLFGGGLMAWAQLSSILEPVNHQRRIIGFDTFDGFVDIAQEDRRGTSSFLRPGAYAVDSYGDLQTAISLFDANRFLGHIAKVEIVKGDIRHTLPDFVERNPHTVVSLLHLDLDLFEPTRAALEHLVPRMPKGSIIAFDQLNSSDWPGETIAALDTLGVRNLRIERCAFETTRSFAVLE